MRKQPIDFPWKIVYWFLYDPSIKIIMVPFYGWGSFASRVQSHYKEAVYTTKFPEIPGTHLIELRRMKPRVNPGATQ